MPLSLSLFVFFNSPNIEHIVGDWKCEHLPHEVRKHIETDVCRSSGGNPIEKSGPTDQDPGERCIRPWKLRLLREFHHPSHFIRCNDSALSRVGYPVC